MSTKTVPVIDINLITSRDTLAKLDRACREWGFFQVINHGIPQDVIDNTFAETHAFFHKPMDVKRAILRSRDNPFGFYDRELTKNARDLKQVFDFLLSGKVNKRKTIGCHYNT